MIVRICHEPIIYPVLPELRTDIPDSVLSATEGEDITFGRPFEQLNGNLFAIEVGQLTGALDLGEHEQLVIVRGNAVNSYAVQAGFLMNIFQENMRQEWKRNKHYKAVAEGTRFATDIPALLFPYLFSKIQNYHIFGGAPLIANGQYYIPVFHYSFSRSEARVIGTVNT